MRSVSRAICTSGDPLSFGCRRNSAGDDACGLPSPSVLMCSTSQDRTTSIRRDTAGAAHVPASRRFIIPQHNPIRRTRRRPSGDPRLHHEPHRAQTAAPRRGRRLGRAADEPGRCRGPTRERRARWTRSRSPRGAPRPGLLAADRHAGRGRLSGVQVHADDEGLAVQDAGVGRRPRHHDRAVRAALVARGPRSACRWPARASSSSTSRRTSLNPISVLLKQAVGSFGCAR